MDPSSAVTLIQKLWDKNHRFLTLIGRLHLLIHRAWEVWMVQICRETNRAAYLLAFKGHLLPLGIIVFCDPPLGLHAI